MFELISGISFSSEIIGRYISKDYAKKNKCTIELVACEDIYYDEYIFLNHKNNKNLYNDLEKYNMNVAIMECEKYEIVVGIHSRQGKLSAVIEDFTEMYIKTHSNEGVGEFYPL